MARVAESWRGKNKFWLPSWFCFDTHETKKLTEVSVNSSKGPSFTGRTLSVTLKVSTDTTLETISMCSSLWVRQHLCRDAETHTSDLSHLPNTTVTLEDNMVSVALPKTNSSSVWCKLPQGSPYDSTGGAEGSLGSVWPLTPACLPKVKITHSRGAMFFPHLFLMKKINDRHRHFCVASNAVLCGFSLHFLPVHSFHVLL